MEIDVKQPVLDYHGTPIPTDDPDVPHTFERMILFALNNFRHDEAPTAEDKMLSFTLAVRVTSDNPVKLSIEDAAYIKKRVTAIGQPLDVGRITELLENA